jgi:hypothetical protein
MREEIPLSEGGRGTSSPGSGVVGEFGLLESAMTDAKQVCSTGNAGVLWGEALVHHADNADNSLEDITSGQGHRSSRMIDADLDSVRRRGGKANGERVTMCFSPRLLDQERNQHRREEIEATKERAN